MEGRKSHGRVKLHIINRPFAVGGICFNTLYRLNGHFLIGPSLDVQTDRSTGLQNPADLYVPSIWKQTALGLSVRGEIEMPFFSINLGAGYNIIRNGPDTKRFYTTYNLKTFITNSIYLNIGYRLSTSQYTHNLMFGLGFRI